MQPQGEAAAPVQTLRPALAFQSASHAIHIPPPSRRVLYPLGSGSSNKTMLPHYFPAFPPPASARYFTPPPEWASYDIIKKKWTDPNTNNMPLTRKITAGLIAGGIGAAVVAMVGMQADGRLPLSQRRNYKSVVDAISQMTKNEGISSLWRGSSFTVNRAMLVTASQLASYDQFKEMILENNLMEDRLGTHVTASFAAGFVAAAASNPVDVIKTRVMNMKVEAGSPPPYGGALDCAMKTVKA